LIFAEHPTNTPLHRGVSLPTLFCVFLKFVRQTKPQLLKISAASARVPTAA
jgi:hypothetical protein